jgi:hypothetical protein
MIEPIVRFVRGATAPSESDSARNGLLSYAVEWHAVIVGFAVGLVAGLTQRWELAGAAVAIILSVRAAPGKLSQLRREPWYALGGLLLGMIGASIPAIVGAMGVFP